MKPLSNPPNPLQRHLKIVTESTDGHQRETSARILGKDGGNFEFSYLLGRIANSEKLRKYSCTWEKAAITIMVADMKRRGECNTVLLKELLKTADTGGEETWEFAQEKLVEMCSFIGNKENAIANIKDKQDRYLIGSIEKTTTIKRLGGLISAIEQREAMKVPSQRVRLKKISSIPPVIVNIGKTITMLARGLRR